MTNKEPIQKRLIDLVSNVLPPNLNLVDVLTDLLEISSDSAYRRIRNETALSIDEVERICTHFNISFDSISNLDNFRSVSFSYNPLASEDDYVGYLSSIRDDMLRISQAQNKQIIYAAEDVPLFHNFKTPELAAFKVFYWLHSVMNAEQFRDKKFSVDVISDEIKDICREIYELYARIPSIEIWSEVTPASLLMQIDYFWQSGIFKSKEDALNICEIAFKELELLQKQAEHSTKYDVNGATVLPEGDFVLYQSDIEIGNNTILVTVEDMKSLYLTHNTLNKIVTVNRAFCDETEKWIRILIKKSTLLSGVAEKQRYQFFRKIISNLSSIEKQIREDN